MNKSYEMTAIVMAAVSDCLDMNSLSDRDILLLSDITVELIDRRMRQSKGDAFTSPAMLKRLVACWLGNESNEVFAVIYLDSHHRLIDKVKHFFGTINGAAVYPRVIVEHALSLKGVGAVAIAHNHPSGKSEPSTADRTLTKKLQQALELVDIRVLDHFVVGEEVESFAELGYL